MAVIKVHHLTHPASIPVHTCWPAGQRSRWLLAEGNFLH